MRSRRAPRCPACWLPTSLCLCSSLPLLSVRTRLIVVMHHRETITSTNTGRLAVRLLEGGSVRVRGLPGAPPPDPLPEGRRLALFPLPDARELTAADAEGERAVLLVPDGNWAQARRIARRDKNLAGAEPVRLPPPPPTRYGLRRNPRDGMLSTLEAIAYALGLLEGPAIEARLLEVFDRFVEAARRARTGAFER
jgi:DTW domain-containing protein YfiP